MLGEIVWALFIIALALSVYVVALYVTRGPKCDDSWRDQWWG